MNALIQARGASVGFPGLRERLRKAERRVVALLVGAVLVAGLGHAGDALAVTVTLDTTSLAGVSGRVAFDLFDGDLVTDNSVTVSNIVSNGTFVATDCSIGCTGGPPFVLDDSPGFGELLYDLKLGTTLTFDLSYTTNFSGLPGTDPDRFALYLLSPTTNFSLVSTNLQSDALLTIDLVGQGIVRTATLVTPVVNVSVGVLAIPEPGSLALATIGFLALFGRRAFGAARARSLR